MNDLRKLAEELAWRRALGAQPDDPTDQPQLEFETLRDRLPIAAKAGRWPWLALAAAASVAFVWLNVRDNGEIKGPHHACGKALLRTIETSVRVDRPLELRGVVGGPCFAALYSVHIDTKQITELLRTGKVYGEVALAPQRFEGPGKRLLVWLATPDAPPSDPEVVRGLLVQVGEERGCMIDGVPCAIDVREVEVQ